MGTLANDDFRKFIDDSRAVTEKKKAKKKKRDGDGPRRKPQPADEGEPKYRDRADERRRGLHVEDDTARYLTAEETQYLGGSIDRTHLVRGLDRVLLSRVKEDRAAGAGTEEAAAQALAGSFPTTFATALGRSVAEVLLKPPRSVVSELFKPRRMAFVYFANEGLADESEDEDDEDDGSNGQPDKPPRKGRSAVDRGVLSIPETLLRSREECPEPRDSMNAAADAAILREVVGVMRAVKLEKRVKDKKKGKAAEAAEALEDKQRHIMKLKMIENPQLAAEAAKAEAAKAAQSVKGGGSQHAQRLAPRPGEVAAAPSGAPAPAQPAARTGHPAKSDSGGSGMFDDVGDDYEVDTSTLAAKKKAAERVQYFGKSDEMKDLPAIAQHGASHGNEAAAQHSGVAAQGHTRQQHGYDASAQQGYYDAHGNWQYYTQEQYSQWAQHGAGGGSMQPPPPPDKSAGGKGKGFALKMGDRAVVRTKFTTEQRQAAVGKASVAVEDDGDVYGADALLGGGGVEDDDEDLRAMESTQRAKNRADFETDEQFQAYKASREAAPKAAFQFGVKVQNGRRSHKDMDKKLNNKLDHELKQLKGMKVDRQGRNVDMARFSAAFDSGAADASATPSSRKRPRIHGV